MTRLRRFLIATAFVSAIGTPYVARAEFPPTIWHAFGIPQGFKHFGDTKINKFGNHPGLEKKPPLKKIADPANLASDVPAIKAAAQIKQQEDLAPQKIKAIKYLAAIGCGCYGGVAEALQAALEDCTEEVRYAAALALQQALNSNCQVCNKTCCTKELAAKMYQRAYDRDASGCFIESSERVRDALAQAVAMCPPDMRDIDLPPETIDDMPEIRDQPPPVPPLVPGSPDTSAGRVRPPVRFSTTQEKPVIQKSSRRGWENVNVSVEEPAETSIPMQPFHISDQEPAKLEANRHVVMVDKTVHGEVIGKSQRGLVRIHLHTKLRPPVGTELNVYHEYVLGTEHMGKLVIVEYEGATAIASPGRWDTVKVATGDLVECQVKTPAPEIPPPVVVATPVSTQPAKRIANVQHEEAGYFAPPPAPVVFE